MESSGGTLKVPTEGNGNDPLHQSMHALYHNSTLIAPPVNGGIIASSRIPIQSNSGDSNAQPSGGKISSDNRKIET